MAESVRRRSGETALVEPVAALTELGGVSGLAPLLRLTTRKRLRRAVERGDIRRTSRDCYRLADADEALVKAAEIGGVASHLSAAALHGWEAAFPATCPWVTVPRNATVADRSAAYVFWADLGGEPGPVTSALRTVLDCARRLDFGPALAVADSALRHGAITGEELMAAAGQVRGKGAAKARRVARHASALAANPFESVLRAIALEAGLEAMPQVAIRLDGVTVHPDVVVVRRAWCWKRTRGSSTPAATRTRATAGATPC